MDFTTNLYHAWLRGGSKCCRSCRGDVFWANYWVWWSRRNFYEPAHPYTWALLSSLPQLGKKGSELFSIDGTPPSLYNEIIGDAFAPRNQYAMRIWFWRRTPIFVDFTDSFCKNLATWSACSKNRDARTSSKLHENLFQFMGQYKEVRTNGTRAWSVSLSSWSWN